MIKIPGLVDIHVHLREPGAEHKEDFLTGTRAALAGGITTVCAMPNTQPPLVDEGALEQALAAAGEKAVCDYGIYLGGNSDNAATVANLADRAAGLKLYLDATYGPLLLEDTLSWSAHLTHWPPYKPVLAHAEGKTLAALLYLSVIHNRPVHICHVSTEEEILLIRQAKENGIPVTCEVTPHHLFLSREDEPALGQGRCEVRPRLAPEKDQQALWDNLDVIDCFATDHAPHTLEEKDSQEPPPGFPGLETALPLMLDAVHRGRLTMEDIILRMYTNPRKIFNIPEQPDTWVEVNPEKRFQIRGADQQTKCGWTPFEGWQGRGCVERVVLRGKEVFREGQVLVEAGFGHQALMEEPSQR